MPDGIYALAEPGKGITAFNMNQEFNLFGRKTFLIGRTFENFPMINDAPLEKVIIKKKEGSWWGNLITGIVVAVALAAVAVAVVATGGAALAVVCLAGAAVGAAVVTTSVAITDHKSGHARSWLDFAGQLFMGTVTGAMAGACIYGLWMVTPVVAEAFGLQASMSSGVISPLTYKIIPSIVKTVGYGLMGSEGALAINEISGIGSGQNWMLDNVFGGDQSKYDSLVMIIACMSMGFMQVGTDNAGLKTEKVKEDKGGSQTTDDVPSIKEVEVDFNYNSKHDEGEFARQLADQEKGMNELTVDEYLKNRKKYISEGRAIESNAAQQAAREKSLTSKIEKLRDSGMSVKDAETQAQKWMDTQAALHNPDQVAGGNYLNIGGVGDKRINSSIGSQWRYRIDYVDEQIRAISEGMTEAEKQSTYLNVKLKY